MKLLMIMWGVLSVFWLFCGIFSNDKDTRFNSIIISILCFNLFLYKLNEYKNKHIPTTHVVNVSEYHVETKIETIDNRSDTTYIVTYVTIPEE